MSATDGAAQIRDAAEMLRTRDIATMRPGLALALARWLDDVSAVWPWDDEENRVVDPDGDPIVLADSIDSYALAIARIINGAEEA